MMTMASMPLSNNPLADVTAAMMACWHDVLIIYRKQSTTPQLPAWLFAAIRRGAACRELSSSSREACSKWPNFLTWHQ
jgi:hypothetical protein